MRSVLIWKRFASAGHNDNGFFGGVSKKLIHADFRFFDNFAISDNVSFIVVGELLELLELIEVLKNRRGVTNDKKFVLERLINAGDGSWNGKLTVDEFNVSNWGFEVDGGNFEHGIAGRVGEWGGLKADEDVNWKHNHEECGGEDFDETLRPTEGIEIREISAQKVASLNAFFWDYTKNAQKWFDYFYTFHLMLIIA